MSNIKVRPNMHKTMDDPFTYVPIHIRDAIKLWIEEGVSGGSFIQAVMKNNLSVAVGHADSWNKEHLSTIVSWIWNYAPSDCWGSVEKCEAWVNMHKGEIK